MELCLQYCFVFCKYSLDDLIKRLRHSAHGIYVGSQYAGSILYADDITLLFGSCRGLQRMLDICADFGRELDICFNHTKSQLMTLGGSDYSL